MKIAIKTNILLHGSCPEQGRETYFLSSSGVHAETCQLINQ